MPIMGTEGPDLLLGYETDDVLLGLGGDDVLSGMGGKDTLVGGAGDDRLYGGAGDDVYVWESGHGNDRIRDDEGANVLRLGDGVGADDVKVRRDADNLYFHVGEEKVCVEGWFRSEKNRLAFLEFADGSKWDTETIEKLLPGAGGFCRSSSSLYQFDYRQSACTGYKHGTFQSSPYKRKTPKQ